MPRCMLDTNALNGVLDYRLAGKAFDGADLYITHIQRDELGNTSDTDRRSALLDVVQVIEADSLPTVGAVFDVSRFDECEWTPSDGSLQSIFDEITLADAQQGKKSSDINRWRDALILETSLKQQMTLITNDGGLAKVALQKDVPIMSLEALLDQLR